MLARPPRADRLIAYIDDHELEGRRGTLDLTGADFVEVQISYNRDKLWVNARQGCVLRIYGMRGMFNFIDLRYPEQEREWQVRELRWAMQNGSIDRLRLDPRVLAWLSEAA